MKSIRKINGTPVVSEYNLDDETLEKIKQIIAIQEQIKVVQNRTIEQIKLNQIVANNRMNKGCRC